MVCVRWDRRRLAFTLASAALSFSLCLICLARLDIPRPRDHVTSSGEILEERPWGALRVWLLRSGTDKFMAKVPVDQSLPEGTMVSFSGEVVPLRERKDGNAFDERSYWLARGVSGELLLTKSAPLGTAWGFGALRAVLRRKILLTLPPLTRGHVLAALLGVRDPDLAKKHGRWGTAHLLAVSGFHVGVVFIMALFLPLRGFSRWATVSLLLWLYVAMAGASASAVRAGLMAQVAILGFMYGRPASGINSVAIAAVVLLLISPWWFWDLGWRLSVICAATVSAVMTVGHGSRLMKGLLSGPVLWLVTAPLIAESFGSVPLAGIVLNLIALPFFAVLLPLAVLCSMPSLMGLPGGGWFTCISEGGFYLWELGADVVGSLPLLSFEPWMVLCSFFALATVFALRFRVSFLRMGLLSLCMAYMAMSVLS